MSFVTEEEINEWVKIHSNKCKTQAFDGAQFKFEFTPTGLVEVQTVKCLVCGKEYTVYIDF